MLIVTPLSGPIPAGLKVAGVGGGASRRCGLDVLRRRLGERVLDIDVRQRAAVLRFSAGACAPTTSTWFLYTTECRAFEIFRIGPRRNLGHFCWSL
jgi:hypothetical protein